MTMRSGRTRAQREDGFALAAVLFVLALLGVLSVTSLVTTGDERQAAHGMRESAKAFYAAEAGANLVIANWDSLQYHTLFVGPGDTVDLGWQTLPENGASYHAVIQQVDNGGQQIYALTVEGRGPGGWGGQRVLSRTLMAVALFEMASAVEGEGSALVKDNSWVDGTDTEPPTWGSACPSDKTDVAGATWDDPSKVQVQSPPAGFKGNPPTQGGGKWPFDDQEWTDLKSLATIHITNGQLSPAPQVAGGKCNYSPPENWGSDDPSNPCFDYFPIILLDGDTQFKDKGYGQGIMLVEGSLKFNAADRMTFNGLILVKGCILVKDADIRGAIAVDGQPGCGDGDFNDGIIVSDDTNVNWSSCAVNRVQVLSGLAKVEPLSQRSFVEVLR